MKFKKVFEVTTVFVAVFIIPVLEINPTFANQSDQATSSQNDLLRLVGARASEITVGARNVKYTFTINIPKTSQPIEKVLISQRGGLEVIKFDKDRIRASGNVEGQKELTISQVSIDSKTKGAAITFDPPVQSGQVLKVLLVVKDNPLTDGNYFFNVIVYPQGKPDAISLGVGRIRITAIRDPE
jgi:Protein of unknown function (DUF2808)